MGQAAGQALRGDPAADCDPGAVGALAPSLLGWFERHGRRDLPWQRPATPYRVWISEIMLQQTQVVVVIPYFERFVARFPAVGDLAAASLDEVLQLWSGLGYYARARHLHAAARLVVSRHGGQLPSELELVQALPGIGRSTAGAILSLALGQRHPILDGNAKRVLARYFEVPGWPGQRAVADRLWALADACMPTAQVAAYNQAIMDLGATLCTRGAPACTRCPLVACCRAHAAGRTAELPEPKPRRARPTRCTQLLLVCAPTGEVLLEQRPPTGLWGGLWGLPEYPCGREPAAWCAEQLGVEPCRVEILPRRYHDFTHFRLDISPVRLELGALPTRLADSGGRCWYDPANPPALGLAAPVARILAEQAGCAPALASDIKNLRHQEPRSHAMTRMVRCIKLGREAEGLARPPYPGELGQRIYEQVSKQAWADWLRHQTMLINENRLTPMDPKARRFLEERMQAYFFGAGSDAPSAYVPPKA